MDVKLNKICVRGLESRTRLKWSKLLLNELSGLKRNPFAKFHWNPSSGSWGFMISKSVDFRFYIESRLSINHLEKATFYHESWVKLLDLNPMVLCWHHQMLHYDRLLILCIINVTTADYSAPRALIFPFEYSE